MSDRAPDYVEPVVGWRLWHVVAEREGVVSLVSPLYRTAWTPRHELVAACRRGAESYAPLERSARGRHISPDPTCGCGIYGGLTPAEAAAYMTRFFKQRTDVLHRVIGTVSLWGRVVEHARGWRASRAYPERIYVPVPRARRRPLLRNSLRRPAVPAERLAVELAAYGVPVQLVECSSLGELAEILYRPAAALAA